MFSQWRGNCSFSPTSPPLDNPAFNFWCFYPLTSVVSTSLKSLFAFLLQIELQERDKSFFFIFFRHPFLVLFSAHSTRRKYTLKTVPLNFGPTIDHTPFLHILKHTTLFARPPKNTQKKHADWNFRITVYCFPHIGLHSKGCGGNFYSTAAEECVSSDRCSQTAQRRICHRRPSSFIDSRLL